MISAAPGNVEKTQPLAVSYVAIFQHVSEVRLPKFCPPSTMTGMRFPSEIDDPYILASRGARNPVDPQIPHAYFVEPERSAQGVVEDVATIFLTNRECPFRCLFCDLWKNTTVDCVPMGAIPRQIDHALARLPAAQHIKLYNSGNFFDRQAVPREDYAAIAGLVGDFHTVIVENHPKLCGEACLEFSDLLGCAKRRSPAENFPQPGEVTEPRFEIAMGLETVHPDILPRMNKQMTLEDFKRAATFLTAHGIAVRAFILLKPPFLPEAECVAWGLRSVEFAFDCGARVCSLIPTRSGNGVMEQLERDGRFSPPTLSSLEDTLAGGIALRRGRVFADLWDAERLANCPVCAPGRITRLRQMNLSQEIHPAIDCSCA
jgi:hypothetical protein